MKKIILTIDYEIYFGNKTGSVEECMIHPTNKLAEILAYNNSKMTVFWDILHFYRLLKLEEQHKELKNDRIAIENQIIDLARKGHDIQLHIHPHWLDAEYKDEKWNFIYDRFKLHTLSKEDDPENVNTISGCVTTSKKLLEKVVRKVKSDYTVSSFRAGGYLIEPFEDLKNCFLENNILIDSSVCPELKNETNIFSFNYTNYPKNMIYNFEDDIKKINDKGRFIEIPITTYKIPLFLKIYFTLLKKYKYKNFKSEQKGEGSGTNNRKKIKISTKIINYFKDDSYDQLTTDSSIKEKYNYLLSRTKNYSTQILHPKIMNRHVIELLRAKTLKDEIQFLSINEVIKHKLDNPQE